MRLPVVSDEPFYDRDYNLCIDCRRCLTACNEVRGVGCLEVKNSAGRNWVGPIVPTLLESGCKFCNACVDVCPTGALRDRTLRTSLRETGVAPCTAGCPAGIDVPRYVQLAGLGRYAEANAVVREKLPFPGILGRACFAPCESVCRRGHLDDPLSIRSLKRIAAEHDDGKWRVLARQAPPSGRRVAVIGAGLAGLTVAFYLAKKGHAVTVFEAQAEAGGMARYAIPAYRLPRAVIDTEVAEVARLGVAFRFNTCVADIDELMQAQGFAAVFLGIGAQAAGRLGIPGDDLPGVVDSLSFLRGVGAGRIAVHADTLLTSRPGVFAGGDAVLGPASLIDAVAQGRKAAAAMDVFFGGDGDIEETLLAEDWQTDPHLGREPDFNQRRRLNPPVIDPKARNNWDEVERCYGDAAARAEGLRCLKCNLSVQGADALLPPLKWRLFDAAAVQSATSESGVFRLFDGDGKLLVIRGVADLRAGLAEMLERIDRPLCFDCEPAHYFSQRETQLLQAYMEQHGAMPPGIGGDEESLDELF